MRAPTPTERAAVFVGGFVAGHLLCRWLEARDRRARAAAAPAWQMYIGQQRIQDKYRGTYGADNPGAN